jgi:hypothetical protein
MGIAASAAIKELDWGEPDRTEVAEATTVSVIYEMGTVADGWDLTLRPAHGERAQPGGLGTPDQSSAR